MHRIPSRSDAYLNQLCDKVMTPLNWLLALSLAKEIVTILGKNVQLLEIFHIKIALWWVELKLVGIRRSDSKLEMSIQLKTMFAFLVLIVCSIALSVVSGEPSTEEDIQPNTIDVGIADAHKTTLIVVSKPSKCSNYMGLLQRLLLETVRQCW